MERLFSFFLSLITFITAAISGQPKNLSKAPVNTQVSTSASGSAQTTTPIPAPPVPPPITHPIRINTTGINLNDLRYPNSTITSQGGGKLSLQSNDSADVITKWYQQKINALGLNATSEVITKTNDNVLNNLAGSNGKATVSVKISQFFGSATVSVDVEVTSP